MLLLWRRINMCQGKVHGHRDFTRLCLPAQEQKREIQMSDLAGSVADGIMASKVGRGTHSKLGKILNSYKVSRMSGLEEMKKLDWRSNVGAGESAQRQLRCLLERDLPSSQVRGWRHGEGKSNWGPALEESRRQKKRKYKEECETRSTEIQESHLVDSYSKGSVKATSIAIDFCCLYIPLNIHWNKKRGLIFEPTSPYSNIFIKSSLSTSKYHNPRQNKDEHRFVRLPLSPTTHLTFRITMYSASLHAYRAKFSKYAARVTLHGSHPFFYILQF